MNTERIMLQILPLSILKSLRNDLRERRKEIDITGKAQVKKWIDYANTHSECDRLVTTILANDFFHEGPIKKIDILLQKLDKKIHYRTMEENEEMTKKKLNDADIETAKAVPIDSIVTVNKAGFFLCVFHNEQHPSCKWYKYKNRFHCFGCEKNGDAIDLVMHLEKKVFIDAVKSLL